MSFLLLWGLQTRRARVEAERSVMAEHATRKELHMHVEDPEAEQSRSDEPTIVAEVGALMEFAYTSATSTLLADSAEPAEPSSSRMNETPPSTPPARTATPKPGKPVVVKMSPGSKKVSPTLQ